MEDSKKLYIKNNYKLVPISGASEEDPDNPPYIDDGMTREETLQLLQ